jgi:hypothetical protein
MAHGPSFVIKVKIMHMADVPVRGGEFAADDRFGVEKHDASKVGWAAVMRRKSSFPTRQA